MERAKKKILLVDDDRDTIDRLKLPLSVVDAQILEAYDGLKALEMIRRENPDLVVLDVLMPKLDGFKLARLFKFDDRFKKIPVITISHISRAQDDQFMKSLGIDLFFSKPFNPEAVVAAIQKLLK